MWLKETNHEDPHGSRNKVFLKEQENCATDVSSAVSSLIYAAAGRAASDEEGRWDLELPI